MKQIGLDKRAEAKRLYEQDGLKLVEIANRLGVKPPTVRGWKAKDKINGREWLRGCNATNQCNSSKIKELYASYLNPKAREIYKAVSANKNKIELLEEMINIKFSNLLTAQINRDYKDPSQSQADSIANRTLSNMIKDYYNIQSGFTDDRELNKVDILLAEINREAFEAYD